MVSKTLIGLNTKQFQEFYSKAILVDDGKYQYETTEDQNDETRDKNGLMKVPEFQSLTVCNCNTHMAVFAIKTVYKIEEGNKSVKTVYKKEEGDKSVQYKYVLGWRFMFEKIWEIEELFDQLTGPPADHDFYIVGGSSLTTDNYNDMLDRIREAIKGFFKRSAKIVAEYENPKSTEYPYVTANLNMNGKLTMCRQAAAVTLKKK